MRELPEGGRYAMFLRKSREDVEAERAGKFETLAKHRAVLERLAADMGVRVSHVYEEIVSGGDLAARADARKMLEDVRAGMWDRTLVLNIIKNPAYKGLVRWNKKRTVDAFDEGGNKVKVRERAEEIVAQGLREPTVSGELWQMANDAVTSRRRHSAPYDATLKDPSRPCSSARDAGAR